nr:unnamed protein product [Haemonchus contortus]
MAAVACESPAEEMPPRKSSREESRETGRRSKEKTTTEEPKSRGASKEVTRSRRGSKEVTRSKREAKEGAKSRGESKESKESKEKAISRRESAEGASRLIEATQMGTTVMGDEKNENASKSESRRANRIRKGERPDNSLRLYAARADRGAKKGQARRKNYFQAMDQYQTTIVGGGTTVGGVTAINEREDEDFSEKTIEEMRRFLADEKLVETKFEFAGKWDELFRMFKRNPQKSALLEVVSLFYLKVIVLGWG